MRKIYFIRHAHPDIPIGERWCVGSKYDIPLNQLGNMQACILGEELKKKGIRSVYCSTLVRSQQTAAYLSPNYIVTDGIHEKDMGKWDGLSFSEIMVRYPDTYNAREKDISVIPECAEKIEDAISRFGFAVKNIIENSHGNIAIVSHGGIMRDFFKMEKLPYTGYLVTDENLNLLSGPIVPYVKMTPRICKKLHEASNLLDNIRRHCIAESKTAVRIALELNKCGYNLDIGLIKCCALLHDIARLEKHHEEVGGKYLELLGYPEIGSIVRQHFEPDSLDINEASVLFIADMNTYEDKLVSVDYRFYESFNRHMLGKYEEYRKTGVMEIFDKHHQQAQVIRDKINSICGKQVVL